jgi:hypothetical protein
MKCWRAALPALAAAAVLFAGAAAAAGQAIRPNGPPALTRDWGELLYGRTYASELAITSQCDAEQRVTLTAVDLPDVVIPSRVWLCLSALARVDAMGLAQQTAQKTPAGQAPDQSRPPLTPEELATQERLEVEVKTREQALRTVKTEIDRLGDDLTETRAAYESRMQDAPDCDANALSLVYFLFGAGAWPEDSASERAFELFRVTQIRLERAREAELEPAEALRLARARLDNFRLTRSATAASLSGTDEKFDRELRKNEERRSLEKQKEDQEQEQKKTPQPISRATDVRLPSTVASFALSDPCPAPVQVLSAIPAGDLPSGLGSFVNINGGGEVGGTDNLFIRSDSGDFVDLFNGRLVNQRTVQ